MKDGTYTWYDFGQRCQIDLINGKAFWFDADTGEDGEMPYSDAVREISEVVGEVRFTPKGDAQ